MKNENNKSISNISNNVGKNILKLRTSAKISRETLAKLCGLTRAYIFYIEKGQTKNPTLDTLQKLAAALKVDIKELLKNV